MYIALNALILTLFSKDLFLTCFFFEISTVCFVFLLFHHGYKSKEALVKFFLYSALNEFLFFFGIGIVYLAYGTFNTELLMINSMDFENYIFLLGLFFIIFSFLFKIGIFPFHFWVVDLYNTAALPIILFISTVPKIAYFYFVWVLLRFFFAFDLFIVNNILFFFILLIVFSLTFSFVKALQEFNFYKLFAYSGIGIIV